MSLGISGVGSVALFTSEPDEYKTEDTSVLSVDDILTGSEVESKLFGDILEPVSETLSKTFSVFAVGVTLMSENIEAKLGLDSLRFLELSFKSFSVNGSIGSSVIISSVKNVFDVAIFSTTNVLSVVLVMLIFILGLTVVALTGLTFEIFTPVMSSCTFGNVVFSRSAAIDDKSADKDNLSDADSLFEVFE